MRALKESILDDIDTTVANGDTFINQLKAEQRLKSFNRKNTKADGRDMFRKPLTPGDFVLVPYKRTTYDQPKIVLDVVVEIKNAGECKGECKLQVHGYIDSNMVIKVDDNILKLLGVNI